MTTIPPKPRTTTADLRSIPDEKRVEDEPLEFKPVRVGELSDLDLLPNHMRLLQGEVRDLVEMVRGVVVPALRRIEQRQEMADEHLVQVRNIIHRQIDRLSGKITELQAQLAEAK